MNGRRNALGSAVAAALAGRALAGVQAPLPSGELAAARPEMPGNGFVIGRLANRARDSSYFDALARTGARSGRLFFRFGVDRPGRRFITRERDLFDLQHVDALCAQRRIRLVIAFEISDVEETVFWGGDSTWRSSYVDCLVEVAQAVKSCVSVCALDVLNEPNPPWPGGSLSAATVQWVRWVDDALNRLRRAGCKTPVIIEGVAGGSALGLKHLAPLDDTNLIYSLHCYTPHDITHQGVSPTWSRRIPYPASADWKLGAWDPELGVGPIDKDRLERELRFAVRFQQRYGLPLYVGEFSCVRWAPAGSATRYVRDCIELFERWGWSWAYHEFRGWPGWDAEIQSEDVASVERSPAAPTAAVLAKFLARR